MSSATACSRSELAVYETQGVALAETALHSGWRRNIQVAVRQEPSAQM